MNDLIRRGRISRRHPSRESPSTGPAAGNEVRFRDHVGERALDGLGGDRQRLAPIRPAGEDESIRPKPRDIHRPRLATAGPPTSFRRPPSASAKRASIDLHGLANVRGIPLLEETAKKEIRQPRDQSFVSDPRHRPSSFRDVPAIENRIRPQIARTAPFDRGQQIDTSPIIRVTAHVGGSGNPDRTTEMTNQRVFGEFQVVHEQIDVAATLKMPKHVPPHCAGRRNSATREDIA